MNDSHAEIICRRAFIRFLYIEVEKLLQGDTTSIFVRQQGDNKLFLRERITFHLYISTAPCGDGALFTPRENQPVNSLPTAHTPEFSSKVQGKCSSEIKKKRFKMGGE